MGKYDLSDNQWKAIKDEIPPKPSTCGRERRDPRELINAINWVGRTGAPWSEIPAEYGPWRTAYNNFRKWTDDGTIGRIFAKIAPKSEETEEIQLDGTYIRAHQHSAGLKKNSKSRIEPPCVDAPKLTVKSAEAEEA
jgi:transposase